MKKNKKLKELKDDNLEENVVSATDCTGLMPAMPHTKAEEDSYKNIYDLP